MVALHVWGGLILKEIQANVLQREYAALTRLIAAQTSRSVARVIPLTSTLVSSAVAFSEATSSMAMNWSMRSCDKQAVSSQRLHRKPTGNRGWKVFWLVI